MLLLKHVAIRKALWSLQSRRSNTLKIFTCKRTFGRQSKTFQRLWRGKLSYTTHSPARASRRFPRHEPRVVVKHIWSRRLLRSRPSLLSLCICRVRRQEQLLPFYIGGFSNRGNGKSSQDVTKLPSSLIGLGRSFILPPSTRAFLMKQSRLARKNFSKNGNSVMTYLDSCASNAATGRSKVLDSCRDAIFLCFSFGLGSVFVLSDILENDLYRNWLRWLSG